MPFGLLFIINVLLIVDLHQKTTAMSGSIFHKKNYQLSINLSVVVMTLLFILFTSPGAVCSQFYNSLVRTYTGNIVLFASDCFAFSYHGLNIVILYTFNKQFRRKFKETFGYGSSLGIQSFTNGKSNYSMNNGNI